MVGIGHGAEKVHVGLVFERDVAFQFAQNMLLQLANSALPLHPVADKKQSKRAKPEEGHAHGPLADLGMDENQWIHKGGETAGEHQNENHRKYRQLQLAALQLVEFFPVEYGTAAHALLPFFHSRRHHYKDGADGSCNLPSQFIHRGSNERGRQ